MQNDLLKIWLAYFLIEPGTFNLWFIILLINFDIISAELIIVIYSDYIIIIVLYVIDYLKLLSIYSIQVYYTCAILAYESISCNNESLLAIVNKICPVH